MKSKKDTADAVKKHINVNGFEGLLPQNLSDEILQIMIKEANSLNNLAEKKRPPTALLLSITKLQKESDQSNGEGNSANDEELLGHFDIYIESIRKEDARRKGELTIIEDSFPTLANILTEN